MALLANELTKRGADTVHIIRTHFLEKAELAFDDEVRYSLHRVGNVGEKAGLLAFVEQIEERSGLAVIVIAMAVVESVRIRGDS